MRGNRSSTGAPDHHLDDRRRRRVRRGAAAGVPSVAQDDEAIGDRLHLFDEMRDVDDRVALRLQPAKQREQPLARRRAPRLLVGSSSTSTRQPTASARAISTSCCAAGRQIGRRCASGEISAWPSCASASRGRLAHRARDRRGRSASAPRRARCSPSRSGAARATAPGRSSPRRRAGLRAGSRGA